jgi:hypothetical protein
MTRIRALYEVSRRDASLCWNEVLRLDGFLRRFIQYIWSRYRPITRAQPIHLDIISESVSPAITWPPSQGPSTNSAAAVGNLLSANAISSLWKIGAKFWDTLHRPGICANIITTGISPRFSSPQSAPALNGEPYLLRLRRSRSVGYKYGAPGGTKDDQFVRRHVCVFFRAVWGSRIWRRRHLGRDIERKPGQNVGCFPVELRPSDAAFAHLCFFDWQAFIRNSFECDLVSPNRTPTAFI